MKERNQDFVPKDCCFTHVKLCMRVGLLVGSSVFYARRSVGGYGGEIGYGFAASGPPKMCAEVVPEDRGICKKQFEVLLLVKRLCACRDER